MKNQNKEHNFTNFMLFALLAIAINLITGYSAGYATLFSTTVYFVGSFLLVTFIIVASLGYSFAAKLSSTIFFNVFFFVFTYYYGLRSIVFIYYFPFMVSHIYMYKNKTTKTEAKIFTLTCFAFIIAIFLTCPMNGNGVLTKKQEMIMFKKNFAVACMLSAYYFHAIYGYLIIQMKLAQEASFSKARFLSIMSHELRTPLNGIISAINLADTTTDEAEKQKYNKVLKTSSEHLLHLVNNVLDYSKASSGKMELNLVSCSIEHLLQNLKAVFQLRFEEKGLALQVVIDKEIKRNVLLDDIRFVQVLTNLLSNALKFTDSGKVVIAARCRGISETSLQVEISVTDTGKGLTKDQQKKIFESFNNVNNKSAKVESSGLGLSISKMIVEMMGGALLLESEANKGSKFYFNITVPIAQMEKRDPVVVERANELSLEGVRVLIAEDNAINMMVAREFLKRWKVEILEAEDGVIAQQMLVKNPGIDILLLDLQMPEMDGFELMAWIRQSGITLPVLAFTAQLMAKEEKAELYELGFIDMIPKPFAPRELQQKLQSALLYRNQLV